ncbi:DNA-binding transcriptional regulator, LysR family [Brevibacterium sandarakinum]|uniref:DNA-binding transcriptional regulator, LysR family n=1 Tax=Brevibacterium sandarakinum TaxID=629680 RepID=A0A1H1XE59_BRESA|nr:LysR substrate-binding domain-containing protein [Brevibacterium sandarakinum]SDT07558.1 DNA-binding transcriptional regulator, LysR family [Brevibacterium sandarakinum]
MLDRRIELLRVLEQAGTITEAAQLLQRSVSGYSRQLRSLADELGVELLEHHGRQVRLTPAAHRLVGFAHDTHTAWEQTKASLAEDGEHVTGTLRIGAHPTALSALVIPNLGGLAAQYPHLRISLSEAEAPQCFDQLIADDLDACIVATQAGVPTTSDRRFHQHRLLAEPIDALVASIHPASGRMSIGLAELAQYPWVLPARGKSGHEEILSACHAAGFVPPTNHYAHDTQAVADLVQATGAVSLTSRFANYRSEAVRIPLVGSPAPTRQLLLCTRAGTEISGPVQTLMQLIGPRR